MKLLFDACWIAVSGDNGEFLQRDTPAPSHSASVDTSRAAMEVDLRCYPRLGG